MEIRRILVTRAGRSSSWCVWELLSKVTDGLFGRFRAPSQKPMKLFMYEGREKQFVVMDVTCMKRERRMAERNRLLVDDDRSGVNPGREVVHRQQPSQLVASAGFRGRTVLQRDVQTRLSERNLTQGEKERQGDHSSSHVRHPSS